GAHGGAAERDATALDVLPGRRPFDDPDGGIERPRCDLSFPETRQIGHDDEKAGAGEPLGDALDERLATAKGMCARDEDERRPRWRGSRSHEESRNARDLDVLAVG